MAWWSKHNNVSWSKTTFNQTQRCQNVALFCEMLLCLGNPCDLWDVVVFWFSDVAEEGLWNGCKSHQLKVSCLFCGRCKLLIIISKLPCSQLSPCIYTSTSRQCHSLRPSVCLSVRVNNTHEWVWFRDEVRPRSIIPASWVSRCIWHRPIRSLSSCFPENEASAARIHKNGSAVRLYAGFLPILLHLSQQTPKAGKYLKYIRQMKPFHWITWVPSRPR